MRRRIAGVAATGAFAVCASALAFAPAAFAATVQGTDFYDLANAESTGEVDVLTVAGETGETVFVSVEKDGRAIAKNLPYTLGQGDTKGSGDNWTGVVTLDMSSFDTKALDGSYTIRAYGDRAGKEALYEGALYGVYAELDGTSEKLIGMRTANDAELDKRSYTPPATLYVKSATYKLQGEAEGAGDGSAGALYYNYSSYDEEATVDGAITYVDQEGNAIATQGIPGIAFNGSETVKIPATITADNGDLYRTVFFKDEVTATNPGSTTFTITCVKMSDSDKAASNHYVATIRLVDQDGAVIATDTVNVTGAYTYTAPATVYKSVADPQNAGKSRVIAYTLAGSGTVHLNAAEDGVTTGARTVDVEYVAGDPDEAVTQVTFNFVDGSKRVNEEGRSLGSTTVSVDAQNPTATPASEFEVDGTTYVLAGDPADYAYTFGSGVVPVVNVYYTPQGYTAPGPYTVTVNYVNFVSGETIDSATYESEPSTEAALHIEGPQEFSANGVDYVRLAGQEDGIEHSYYSGINEYVVYYRDVNDELTSGTVINNIRVTYVDGEPVVTTVVREIPGTTTGTTVAPTTTTAAATTTNAQLNPTSRYNVNDGAGNNGTLTNESGVDSNTERIGDDANPLAQGTDEKGAEEQTGPQFNVGAIVAIAVAVAALALLAAFLNVYLRRRRKPMGGLPPRQGNGDSK